MCDIFIFFGACVYHYLFYTNFKFKYKIILYNISNCTTEEVPIIYFLSQTNQMFNEKLSLSVTD